MSARPGELEYYRRQCDELGGRLLRAQAEATQARRDAQRHRSLALLVQQLHAQADEDPARLGEQLLMLLVERLQVDAAALALWQPEADGHRVQLGLGVATGLLLPRAAGGGDEAAALQAAGLARGLWVTAPPAAWALLLGQRQAGGGTLEEADRAIAEAALRVHLGLLERLEAARTLRASEANYRSLFEGAQDAFLVIDARELTLMDANQRALELLGCSLAELRSRPASDWLLPHDPALWRPVWIAALKGQSRHIEARLRNAQGRVLWAEITITQIDAGRRRLLAVLRDISARKHGEESLRRMQERLDLALEGAEIGLYDCNLETGELTVDPRYLRLLGCDASQAPRTLQAWFARIHEDDRPTVQRVNEEARLGRSHKVEMEYRLRHQSGRWIWVLDRGKGFDWDPAGRPRRAAGTCVDVTERKLQEASIHRLAFFDPLTDLPNRRLFLDRLVNAQAAARRGSHLGAVLFLDLDHFKHVNDARGHEAGDHLLQAVAARLQPLLRTEDTVSRFGGDEFVVLLANLTRNPAEAPACAHGVAEKLRLALAQPFALPAGEFVLAASIGVSLFGSAEASAQDILREADTALYKAKEGGRNCVRFFEAAMQHKVQARFELELDLRQALARDELWLALQPQVDAAGRLFGVEALLRWQHPRRGLVAPDAFIALAEDSGLILPIGQWVLQQACRLQVQAAAAGQVLRMSVNVSPRQFHQEGFVDLVRAALADSGAAPQQLVLEITEGLVLEDSQATLARLQQLKALGVQLSIDDFGTGYSSLSYLKRMPVDEIKIDRSFVRDAPVDADDGALVEAILAVSRHLRFAVLAEGVETPQQLEFLAARGCTRFQGYHFGRPVPAAAFIAGLTAGARG